MPKLPNLATAPIRLPGTAELASKPAQRPKSPPPVQVVSPAKPRTVQKPIMDEVDPWGSPALHKNHNHAASTPNGTTPAVSNGVTEPARTTSTFTTASVETSTNGSSSQPPSDRPPVTGSLWGSYTGTSSGSFSNAAVSGLGGNGFGGDAGGDEPDRPARVAPPRAFGGGRVSSGVEELILVTLLPEKEGVFMFQHHNYQVASSRRGSTVVRRYSDFVWLLDCLQKRYPFRQLPLLPPKRVAGMYAKKRQLSLD